MSNGFSNIQYLPYISSPLRPVRLRQRGDNTPPFPPP